MITVSLVDNIAAKAASLPVELQRQALDFIEFLLYNARNVADSRVAINGNQREEPKSKPPFKSVLGSLEHLGIDVTDEDIAEVRREMWANFPREFPK